MINKILIGIVILNLAFTGYIYFNFKILATITQYTTTLNGVLEVQSQIVELINNSQQ